MTNKKILIALGLAILPGIAIAQTAMRPRIAAPTQTTPVVAEMTPEWVKEMNAMKGRITVLEGKLNAAQQELDAFRKEYGSHTHKVPTGQLVYDNTGKVVGYKVYAGTVASDLPSNDKPGT